MHIASVAFQSPLHKVVIYTVCKRRQVFGVSQFVADNGNQIHNFCLYAFLHLFRILDGVAVPQALRSHVLRCKFVIEHVEFFNNHRAVGISVVIDNPQGNDFVLILVNKPAEIRNHHIGGFFLVRIKACKIHTIEIHIVNDLLVNTAYIFDILADIGVVEWFHRFANDFLLVFSLQVIFVKCVQEIFSKHSRRFLHTLLEVSPFIFGHLGVQAHKPICKRCQGVGILRAHRHVHHQFFQANGRLSF